jgi:glycerol uptake facilitator-like aquaporin
VILALGPVSGAHFNPVVTLAAHSFGGRQIRDTVAYLIAQFLAAFAGVMLANAMFDVSAAAQPLGLGLDTAMVRQLYPSAPTD